MHCVFSFHFYYLKTEHEANGFHWLMEMSVRAVIGGTSCMINNDIVEQVYDMMIYHQGKVYGKVYPTRLTVSYLCQECQECQEC